MSAVDRLFSTVGFWLHHRFHRRPRLRAVPARPAAIPELRYRLRRDGLREDTLAGCFGSYAAGQASREALAAAHILVHGGVVELARSEDRRLALAAAAFARALHGEPVHLLSASEAAAQSLHEFVAPRLAALGVESGCILRAMPAAARREVYGRAVVCGAYREVANDYLRDRLESGRGRGLSGKFARLGSGQQSLMPAELGCLLVEEADLALLDDAQAPVAIATEVDQSKERLLYEQALELARSLALDADFVIGDEGIALTEPAARRLERLVAPLGGVWSSRQRREELVGLALEALHLFQRDVDYRVQTGRVVFPQPPPAAEAPPGPDEELKKLVEVKEGCALSARREVLARLSLPRFFSRYRTLSGVCADARGVEPELWALYGLKTWLAGRRGPAVSSAVRVFGTVDEKRTALAEAVGTALHAGHAVTVAVRRPAEAQAIQAALQAAGVQGDALAMAVLPGVDVEINQGGQPRTVLVAELPEAARHVARLQPGDACTVLLSLDEEAVAAGLGGLAWAARLALGGDPELSAPLAAWLGRRAQRAAERMARGARLELKAREQMLDDLLAFSGQRE